MENTASNPLIRKVKRFDLVAGDGRLYRLIFPNRLFVPAVADEDEESVVFSFDTTSLTSVSSMTGLSKLEKLRLLLNIPQLLEAAEGYSFTLHPDNVYVDRNLEPKILMRDLRDEDNRHDFCEEYRALAGCLLEDKYHFEDYLMGGMGLYKKKKSLRLLAEADSVDKVWAVLEQAFQEETAYISASKLQVDRKLHRSLRVLTPACILLFLAGAGLVAYMNFSVLPYRQALINANHSFLREDFDSAIDNLIAIQPMNMPKEERYQLARAYVISESLSQDQRRNILSNITLMTDDTMLVYWIEVGRAHYLEAIDTAQRLGDDELLLYALLKYEVAVQMDDTLGGEEKAELVGGLGQQIEALRKQQEEKRETVEEELPEEPAATVVKEEPSAVEEAPAEEKAEEPSEEAAQ